MERYNKVAKITLFFWIIKVLATTLGETLGDMLSMTFDIGYLETMIIAGIFFLVVLFIQIYVKRFHSGLYWLVIIGTTTVGTEISDFMDRSIGLGYAYGSLILFILLILILFLWHHLEKGIRYYPITKVKVELLFWLAVLISNSLGTAFGDYLSDNIGLSYIYGALVTSMIIAVVILMHYFTHINDVLLFWIAFIFTRPFGATFGDLLTKPIDHGGLDLGTIPASIINLVLLISLVIISDLYEKRISRNDTEIVQNIKKNNKQN